MDAHRGRLRPFITAYYKHLLTPELYYIKKSGITSVSKVFPDLCSLYNVRGVMFIAHHFYYFITV